MSGRIHRFLVRPLAAAPVAAAFLLLLVGAGPARADADTPGDAILTDLAEHVSHGFADKYLSMEQLEARIARGEHVSVLCGQVSLLGQRALARAGIPSRRVGTFSSRRYEMYDVPDNVVESHAMLEVWDGARWVLYDLDGNVQPVTAGADPVSITEFARMTPRYYRVIATDALYDPTADEYPTYENWLFSHHEEWYDRVLDIVTIQAGGEYLYTGPRPSPISGFHGYRWVDAATFARIVAGPPGTVPGKPPVTAPRMPPRGSRPVAPAGRARTATTSFPRPGLAPARTVPQLRGLTQRAARRKLRRVGLRLGKVVKRRHMGWAGRVIRQRARAGRRVPPHSRVRVVIGRR